MTRVSGILGTPSEATTSSSSQVAYTPPASSRASSAVHRDIPIESVEQVPIPASSLPHSAEYQNAAKSTSPSSGSSTSEFTFRGLSPEEPSRRETTASDIINGVGCAFSELRLATPSRFTVSSEQVTSSASTPRSANFNGNENSPLDMRSLASFLPGARQQSHTPTLASHDSGLTVPSSPRQNASSLTTPSPSRRRSGSRPLQERHEIQDEEPPQSRFHDPAFQEAFRESKELVLALKEALATSSLHDEPDTAMKKLFQEAKQLSLFKSPASRTVGLVGDSGCGKSSLVNSLLDVKALAHATNSRGSACTCVVTEYLYHERDDFVIEVDSFSTEEIEDQITELLGAFRLYKLGDLGGPEQTEQNECRDKADLALDTFVAMFRGLLSKDNHEILLGDDEEDVLNMLMDWVEELNISSRDRTETLRTAEECSNRLIELTSDHNSPQEPASWPFIRKIRVFTNAYILSKGLVLVDLPGLRDLNSARRNITERHMRNMDEIFAIASIGRAATDAGVAAVFQLARQAKLANVSIICTKSDEIRADEAVKDWKGQPKSMVQSLMDRVDQSQRNRTKLKAEIRDYDDEYDDLTEEERRDLHQLRSSLSRTEKLLVSHKFELKKFLVETRNEHVRKELNKTYAKSVLDNKLTVFFASNVDYWNSRNEPKDDALPVLRLSGILGIRKHCVALVAEAQYRAVKRYISHEIPALFDSLQLWIESGSGSLTAERKIAVCNALDKLELVLRRLTSPDSIVDRNPMKESFRANIVRYDRRERWRQSAINAASDWSGWHHSSYISFCQNYGDHYTRTIGSRNWNEELIEKAAREMQAQWEYVLLDIDEWEESAAETITSIQRLCLNTLRTEFDDDVLQMGSLTGILTHRLTLLAEDIETILDDMRKDLASLETNAFTGIRSSFIGDAMRPLYRACNSEYGSGSDRRRKNIIGQGVANPQFFPQHILRFRTDLDAIADECNAKLREKIGEHLAEIQESMKLIRDENVALESEKDPDFRARVEEVLGELKERHHVVMARL